MEMMPSNKTPNPEPGVYIDPSSPASCSGQITKWSFCYHHNSESGTGPFRIGLQVWRINNLDEGMRISDSIVSIEVMNLVNFQCADKELSPDEYINITEGDVLAVRQISRGISNATISTVVNTEEPNTLMYLPVSPFIPEKFPSSNFEVQFRSSNAILVSATVTVSETTSPGPPQGRTNPIEVTTMSDNNSTNAASIPGERTGLSLGVIVGIVVVIVFLLIIAITVLITIIILCLNKRQKMKKNSDVSSIGKCIAIIAPINPSISCFMQP